ncbi:TetR/AcrR family transcriptional regulator [Echinicola strongylocentroti]|uniref:TetR/AcrR family transcriptional regulator n=1 Tax=Echinicola strongylocentroti TaxID=1795355 RepID=A0A2Z4IKY4_9BACT|nr:TetR family transcriptional regulator [Echinicola strongylocentroti]AWW31033.1 TetR/AcrR family transcriptional regulator [Echinicola strongylocentroti]
MEFNEKKVKIMGVAESLFAKKGFSGTSVREIAKKANVNVAMISYYFDSKEKLLSSILLYKGDYLKSKIDSILKDNATNMWQKLDWLIDEYVAKFVLNQSLHRIILRENSLQDNLYLREFVNQRRLEHYKMIRDFVIKGQELGVFKENVDLIMLYSLLPGTTKHTVFNEDFLKLMVKEETGEDIGQECLKKRTQEHIRNCFRLFLEKD